MTSTFLVCVISILVSGVRDSNWLDDNIPDASILNLYSVQLAMNIGLLCLGILSVVFCYLHWHYSIVPLYTEPEPSDAEKNPIESYADEPREEDEGNATEI